MLSNKFRLLFVQQHFPTIITHVTPGTFEFCTRIIRVYINICMEIAAEWNIQISNISTSKRCNLQLTTWCVVQNVIFGPWMSRRGQGRCSNLVKNMLTQIFSRSFREIPVYRKGRGQTGGGYYEKCPEKSPANYIAWMSINKQHYALSLMFAQFRRQQLQSYSFHSRDRPRPLMSRCGEIRKKNISKLWILVMMTNVGGGLPGGGDRILQGFEFLNIWMVRHEKGVRVRNGLLNRCEYPVSPSQRWPECWEMRWEMFCPYSP